MSSTSPAARVAIAVALCFGTAACHLEAPTGSAVASTVPVVSRSVDGRSSPDGCRDCRVGPVVFVRESGAPHSDSITFSATQGKSYVVDLDDEASQGSDATVTLNGVTLLSHRVTGRAAAQHYHELVVLRDINTLVVRLVGKPGSTLRVAIWLFRPVTLDAVTLAPGTPKPGGKLSASVTVNVSGFGSAVRFVR